MIITNEKLLKEFRQPGACQWCGRWSDPRQPHHIRLKGVGGGRRLDVPFNLISLGHAFACRCHDDAHRGRLTEADFLAVVARRCNVLQPDIEAALNVLRRLDRSPSRLEVRVALGQVGAAARGLLVEVLGELVEGVA